MITKFSCHNFRNINKENLEFEKINILIGPNNSGKTNMKKPDYDDASDIARLMKAFIECAIFYSTSLSSKAHSLIWILPVSLRYCISLFTYTSKSSYCLSLSASKI